VNIFVIPSSLCVIPSAVEERATIIPDHLGNSTKARDRGDHSASLVIVSAHRA
jgi:hypothetical protein